MTVLTKLFTSMNTAFGQEVTTKIVQHGVKYVKEQRKFHESETKRIHAKAKRLGKY